MSAAKAAALAQPAWMGWSKIIAPLAPAERNTAAGFVASHTRKRLAMRDRTRVPWTPDMDDRLRVMAGAHATARDIATALDLSERSVRARAVEIGVGFTKGRRRA